MKKTLYTFLVWNFLLFVAGLSDIVFYRNLTSVEGMTISWTQPALVSITSFLILLSIYYGMHQLLFGKNFYLKLEIKQEDIDKLRNSIYDFLKKGEIDIVAGIIKILESNMEKAGFISKIANFTSLGQLKKILNLKEFDVN